jgi:hypothetical protein
VRRCLSACAAIIAAACLLFAATASAKPCFAFGATPGKLPKHVLPRNYAVRIAAVAGQERLSGNKSGLTGSTFLLREPLFGQNPGSRALVLRPCLPFPLLPSAFCLM